jgi:MFS family permease
MVQAVLAPLIASLSDTFQARKAFLVGPAIISFIGCAIAPGSSSIYRLIAAQVLIGFGFATVPLAYSVPSDILPRRWRPSEFNFELVSISSFIDYFQWARLSSTLLRPWVPAQGH